ncbi:MAG: hypothetical protein EAZ24_15375, partial [Burkholderiales bacterium]
RRTFLQSSAALAVSLPSLGAVIAAPLVGASDPATSLNSTKRNVDADLLHALGERIGRAAAEQVAPNGEAVSLMYFDYAGPSIAALKAGIVTGLTQQCGEAPTCNEISLPYGDRVGVALVRNLATAEEIRIEIDATMLSHLAMIEELAPSAGIAKTSLLQADASYFYRATERV